MLVGAIIFGAGLLTFATFSLRALAPEAKAAALVGVAVCALAAGIAAARRTRVATADALFVAAAVALTGVGRLSTHGVAHPADRWAVVLAAIGGLGVA